MIKYSGAEQTDRITGDKNGHRISCMKLLRLTLRNAVFIKLLCELNLNTGHTSEDFNFFLIAKF